jgi:hypothetical protein
MGTIDDIKIMQQQGKSEFEIRSSLQQRGIPEQQISEGMAQSKIKNAVAPQQQGMQPGGQQFGQQQQGMAQQSIGQQSMGQQGQPGQMQLRQQTQGINVPAPGQPSVQQSGYQQGNYDGMQPSMLEQGGQQSEIEQQSQDGYYQVGQSVQSESGGLQDYSAYQVDQAAGGYGGYDSYQPYQEGMSSDIITEISEQVVSERLSVLRDKLQEAISFKSVFETKLNSVDERLRRIEQIIDRLQISIMQKVGDYVNDVKSIKDELVETQKSFKKLAAKKSAHGGKKP